MDKEKKEIEKLIPYTDGLIATQNKINEIIDIINNTDKKERIKRHVQLIQTYTDDERVMAQCNLILGEIEDE
jgi:hypothetical protein